MKITKSMQKDKIIKALAACSEFCCGECPYQYLDHDEYKLRCIHTLIEDVHELINAGIILNTVDVYPCKNCDVGWASISAEGCRGCEETCVKLKEYEENK